MAFISENPERAQMQHQSYIVTFEDGSEAYLQHFGVKGMKWGVWNAETRARRQGVSTAKSEQKALRKLDKQLGKLTIEGGKTATAITALKRAKPSPNRQKRLKQYSKRLDAIDKETIKTGKELTGRLKTLESSGYSWKATPTNFNQPFMFGTSRSISKKHGKVLVRDLIRSGENIPNAYGGNRFTVKNIDKLSPNRREAYRRKQTLNNYRPQRVTYRYY